MGGGHGDGTQSTSACTCMHPAHAVCTSQHPWGAQEGPAAGRSGASVCSKRRWWLPRCSGSAHRGQRNPRGQHARPPAAPCGSVAAVENSGGIWQPPLHFAAACPPPLMTPCVPAARCCCTLRCASRVALVALQWGVGMWCTSVAGCKWVGAWGGAALRGCVVGAWC
jgi:hypothetical protein